MGAHNVEDQTLGDGAKVWVITLLTTNIKYSCL